MNKSSNLIELEKNGNGQINILVAQTEADMDFGISELTCQKFNHDMILIFVDLSFKVASEFLKRIWVEHKILNVLAIVQTSKVSNTNFSALIFNPFLKHEESGHIHNYTINKQNIRNKTSKIMQVYKSRIYNLYQYPMKVCMFELLGYSHPVLDEAGEITKFSMIDGEIADTLAQVMNYHQILVVSRSKSTFGTLEPDGNYSGALGVLESGEVDLAANIRIIQAVPLDKSMFLHPIHYRSFGILTPKMTDNLSVTYLEVVQVLCGIYLTLMIIFIVVMWIKLSQVRKKIFDESKLTKDCTKLLLELFGALLMLTQPMPRYGFEKCLFITVVFCSMILCTTYQAKLFQYLATSKKSGDFSNVEELLLSGMNITMHSSLRHAVSLERLVEKHNLIKNREIFMLTDRRRAIQGIIDQRNSALIDAELPCRVTQSRLYSNETGEHLLHLIKNVMQFPSTLMTLKKSPFKTRFDRILSRLYESGIVDKMYVDAIHKVNLASFKRPRPSAPITEKYFYTMEQLDFVFFSWSMSMIFCCFVFILELIIYLLISRNNEIKTKAYYE